MSNTPDNPSSAATIPPAITSPPPVLELFGQSRPTLHRPRLAAAALLLMSVGPGLAVLIDVLFILSNTVPAIAAYRVLLFRIYSAVALVDAITSAIALVLLASANLGKGRFSPTPMWALIITGLLQTAIFAGLRMYEAVIFNPARKMTPSRTQWQFDSSIEILLIALDLLGDILWIGYAARIALHLRSRLLAGSTAAVVGMMMMLSLLHFGLVAYRLMATTGWPVYRWSPAFKFLTHNLPFAYVALDLIAFGYFIMLAQRLFQMARSASPLPETTA